MRTWWRQPIDHASLDESLLELVLPENAELSSVPASLLRPGAIDDVWTAPVITVATLRKFFDGVHTMTVSRGGYDEPVPVPRASTSVVDEAIAAAVRVGDLWLTAAPASLLSEEVPPGLLSDVAELQAPPDPIPSIALLPDVLPTAWKDGRTTALSLVSALSQKAGRNLPWTSVRTALDAAFRVRVLERVEGGSPWPTDYAGAGAVTIRLPSETKGSGDIESGPRTTPVPPDTRVSPEIVLKANQLQDLADVVPDLLRVTAGQELTFSLKVAVKGGQRPKDDVVKAVNQMLKDVASGLEVQ